MWFRSLRLTGLALFALILCQCATTSRGNLGGPTVEEREEKIASEPDGDFYYGRRYFVEKTRFWGYLREPRKPWSTAKLVMMREDRLKAPDRLPEDGQSGARYAFDHNFEYRIRGRFTGREAYDPNSNQILPEFLLTGYELLDRNPGWLFRPSDRYHRHRITMMP